MTKLYKDEQNKFFADLIDQEHEWLGINDLANEGKFMTAQGDEVRYVNWLPDEPNNFEGLENFDQDAVRMHSNGNWSDTFVYNQHAFVCVIDPRMFSVQSEFIKIEIK